MQEPLRDYMPTAPVFEAIGPLIRQDDFEQILHEILNPLNTTRMAKEKEA